MSKSFILLCVSATVALLAVVLGCVGLLAKDHPLDSENYSVDLDSSLYDIVNTVSPIAVGWKLKAIAAVLGHDVLGIANLIGRFLLWKNGNFKLRELAAQLLTNGDREGSGREYSLSAPIIRLNSSEVFWHESQVANNSRGLEELNPTKQSSYHSIDDFYTAYKQKKTTPSQVVENIFSKGKMLNEKLRFMQEFAFASAREEARLSTARWEAGKPLGVWDGIPVVVKTEFSVKDLKKTDGMIMHEDDRQRVYRDDIMVSRLRRAGAIVVGTTVMYEFGVSPVGYNWWYKGPKNPYDPSRFPGGSSSGSAVAVASGLVPVAIGADGGGSIRIPAAWCGCVGLAPSFSRVLSNSSDGSIGSVGRAGPITSSVKDTAYAYLLLAQKSGENEDAFHPYMHQFGGDGPPPPHLSPRFSDRPVRVGIWPEYNAHGFEGRNNAGIPEAMEWVMKKLGGNIVVGEFKIPNMRAQAMAHGLLISSEFAVLHDLEASQAIQGKRALQAATMIQLRIGYSMTAVERLAAERVRAWAIKRWRSVLKEFDVIITPTLPATALHRPPGSDEIGITDTTTVMQMMRFIWPVNLLGLAGLSVPIGHDPEGLPIGLQVICLHWHEADCLRLGKMVEEVVETEGHRRPPPNMWVDVLEK